MSRLRRLVPRVAAAGLVIAVSYAYAQFRQDVFRGFGALRGEQGDPAELPPAQLPDRDVPGCHMLYTSVRREANGAGWRTRRRGEHVDFAATQSRHVR